MRPGAADARRPPEISGAGARATETMARTSHKAQGDGAALILTKLRPPTPETGLVGRPRLIRRLDRAVRKRLVLVCAPAGFGKSSVLAQWMDEGLARGDDVGWVSLDPEDNDTTRFVRHLVAAIRTRRPGFGDGVLRLADQAGPLAGSNLPAVLVNAIAAFEKDFYLILDDVHFLEDKAVLEALALLVQRAGSKLHLVMATREIPDLPLARLRATGQLVEIDGRDLQFLDDETSAYFAKAEDIVISPDDIAALNERTEGWIAGLQLAAISLRARGDKAAFIRSFSGGHRNISDFLAEDVLQRQGDDVRRFLLDTAILSRLSADLCDRVTGRTDGRAMLTALERANLFLFSLDEERQWYRYHHMFQEFLQRRLAESAPERPARLHRSAADWYWDAGQTVDAIQHTLAAGDTALAARRLDAVSEGLFAVGRLPTIMELARRIPDRDLAAYPRLRLDQIWGLQLRWRFDEARAIMTEVRATLDARADANGPSGGDADLAYLEGKLTHRELMLASLSDDMPEAEKLTRRWLARGLTDEPYLQASARSVLLYARREQYDLKGVADAAAINDLYLKGGAVYGTIWHDSIVGPSHMLAGDLERAEKTYLHGLDTAARIAGRFAPVTAMPALLQAEVCYEQNRLDEARRLVRDYLPLAGETGFVEQLIAGMLCGARLAFLDDRPDEAARILEEGERYAGTRGFVRLRRHVVAERVRQALLGGDPDRALRLGADAGLNRPMEQFLPRPGVTTGDAVSAFTAARLAIARGDGDAAVPTLRRWLRFAEERGCRRPAAHAAILATLASQRAGDPLATQRFLRTALGHATPGKMIRCFADEGPAIASLLQGIASEDLGIEKPLHDLTRAALDALRSTYPHILVSGDDTAAKAPVASLQPRELEILRLVGSGMLNQEVATQLGLSAGTVKWYLQQIYGKLGVHRRSQAAGRARQLGLIP